MIMKLSKNNDNHNIWTRQCDEYRAPKPNKEYGRPVLRHSLPILINSEENVDTLMLKTRRGITNTLKYRKFSTYTDECHDKNCYACNKANS